MGHGSPARINVNIGISNNYSCKDLELEKVKIAVDMGADTLMDLSTLDGTGKFRETLIKSIDKPLGTVLIYEVMAKNVLQKKDITEITPEEIIKTFENQAKQGVDFSTIHADIDSSSMSLAKKSTRKILITSRGGAIVSEIMERTKLENPLLESFEKLLEIAKDHDVTLSIGASLRPGCIDDAMDNLHLRDLSNQRKLVKMALKMGVKVIAEGLGHADLNSIREYTLLAKKNLFGIPLHFLGPLPTDIAAPYDHIAGAIGIVLARNAGADLFSILTPAEHLMCPTSDNIREGVIAARIGAHIADIDLAEFRSQDSFVGKNRGEKGRCNITEGLMFPNDANKLAELYSQTKECTMCSSMCALKKIKKYSISKEQNAII